MYIHITYVVYCFRLFVFLLLHTVHTKNMLTRIQKIDKYNLNMFLLPNFCSTPIPHTVLILTISLWHKIFKTGYNHHLIPQKVLGEKFSKWSTKAGILTRVYKDM